MRNKPFLTTGALFMGLILVLGAIGIVNGLWSKNLVINGTVTTGDLNADWDCAWTNDDGTATGSGPDCPTTPVGADVGADPHGSFPPFPYSNPFIEKDVAECRVLVDPDEEPGEEDFGAQVAEVTINNAYPSYECEISFLLTNTGSIPFNFIAGTVDLEAPLEGRCLLADGADRQVDPGQELGIDCLVHVMQEAEQSDCTGTTTLVDDLVTVDEDCDVESLQTYTFSVKVCVAQWNEAATYQQCVDSLQHEGPD